MNDAPPKHQFWDSCVLIRYLTGTPPRDEGTLSALIDLAKAQKLKIWHSTMLFAEVRPSQLQQGGFDSMQDLNNALEGALFPIGPTPNVLMRAARLREHAYLYHTPQKEEKTRVMSVPDAIHLCTALHIKEDRGVSDLVFCTYDDGKGSNYEEKAVSLLRYHEYASAFMDDQDVVAVCELERQKPQLDQGRLV